jgi:tetratricopeptide (TPR) repeat protein
VGLRAAKLLSLCLLGGCLHRGAPASPPPTPTTPPRPPALQAPAVGWYLRGALARSAGELDEAARAFEEAALFDRQSPYPLIAAGEAHAARGEVALARARYEEALRRAPGEPRALAGLAALATLAVPPSPGPSPSPSAPPAP